MVDPSLEQSDSKKLARSDWYKQVREMGHDGVCLSWNDGNCRCTPKLTPRQRQEVVLLQQKLNESDAKVVRMKEEKNKNLLTNLQKPLTIAEAKLEAKQLVEK